MLVMWRFYLFLVDCLKKEGGQLLVSLLGEGRNSTGIVTVQAGKEESGWKRVV